MIREVSQLGMEVCVTLGQLSGPEAAQLKAAGVTAYNHNIDTSPEFYPEIVTTPYVPGSARHDPGRPGERDGPFAAVGLWAWARPWVTG